MIWLISSFFSTIFFILCQKILLEKFIFNHFSFYKYFNDDDKKKWNSTCISTIHAVIVNSGFLVLFLITPEFNINYNLHYHKEPIGFFLLLFSSFSLGFFIVDLIFNVMSDLKTNGIYCIHHIPSIISIILVLYMRKYYLGLLIFELMEGTTFFINNITFLKLIYKNCKNSHFEHSSSTSIWSNVFIIKTISNFEKNIKNGLPKKILELVNSIFIVLSWGFWRLYFGVYLFWSIVFQKRNEIFNDFPIWIWWISIGILFTCLNLYWFCKILIGICKLCSK